MTKRFFGGGKVAIFIFYKGKKFGAATDDAVIVEDIYPTIAGLLGIPFSFTYQLEGRDILQVTEELAVHYYRTPCNFGLRKGECKLVVHGSSPGGEKRVVELYNIEQDPVELINLSARMPEQAQQMLNLLQSEYRKDPAVYVNPELLDK